MPDPWRSRITGHGEADPATLTPNPRNWRRHPRPQLDALAGVLTEVGWVQDVILNRTTGHVVDGHARIDLALSRKEPSVPVVYVDLTPEEEGKVLATLDPIGAMAGADKEALGRLLEGVRTDDAALRATLRDLAEEHGLEYGGDGLPGREEAPEPDADRAEELREQWQTERGQVWAIGRHRVMCGDSTDEGDVRALLGGLQAAMVLTDPPYVQEHDHVWRGFAGPAFRACADEAFLVSLCGHYQVPLVLDAITEGGWAWYWMAAAANNNQPIMHGYSVKCCHKPCVVFRKGGARPQRIWVDDFGLRVKTQEWQASQERHKWGQAAALFYEPLEAFSTVEALVFEPFVGGGSTIVACEGLRRRCFGLEIDPGYTAVTLERLSEMGMEPRLES